MLSKQDMANLATWRRNLAFAEKHGLERRAAHLAEKIARLEARS